MHMALVVEYDGCDYFGWQAQLGLKTVQGTLEAALSRVANESISVICAGRTDTGVHAFNQVVHFESQVTRTVRAWMHGTNAYLPKDICVRWGSEMPEEFHARYSALARRSRYVIDNTPIRPALSRRHVAWQYRQLDADIMNEAAQCLIGEHDFTSFRSIECQSHSAMRNVQEIKVRRYLERVVIDITANAFLHHMVRNIVGVLMAVGTGRYAAGWVSEVLAAKDRRMGAETAPAYGLYLTQVIYPEKYEIFQSPLSGMAYD